MSATVPPTLPVTSRDLELDGTLGVLLIGDILAAVLFGITSVQMYTYYGRCRHDGSVMKFTIAILWVLDAIPLALTSQAIYYYTITNFMNPTRSLYCTWSLAVNMIFSALCQVIVSGVYAHRIWKFSGQFWTLLVILPLAFCDFAGSIAMTVLVLKVPLFTEFMRRFSWLWSATFAVWASCDCSIAVILCVVLIKSRTGFRKTDSLIKMLVLYSISTGALTASVAIASVILHVTTPNNFVSLALGLVLPKLMLNSLLALLNSRKSLRDKIRDPISIHLSQLGGDAVTPPEDAQRRGKNRVEKIVVKPSQSDLKASLNDQDIHV